MALVLVTGASTGIGLATVEELVDTGHKVVLHARQPDRVADIDIRHRVHDRVYADLSDVEQTVALAEHLNELGRFDAVIHNAGVTSAPAVFAVNLLAPYVLTALMTPPHRSIMLSSGMHLSGSTDVSTIDFDRPKPGDRSYGDSKLYVTALAMALARQRPEMMAHAVDPGWVPTRMGGPSATDPLDEAHRTQVRLATAPASEINPPSGGYWRHNTPQSPHPAALDVAFQEELVQKLAKHTGLSLPSALPAALFCRTSKGRPHPVDSSVTSPSNSTSSRFSASNVLCRKRIDCPSCRASFEGMTRRRLASDNSARIVTSYTGPASGSRSSISTTSTTVPTEVQASAYLAAMRFVPANIQTPKPAIMIPRATDHAHHNSTT
ncbi:NAD(P)-dependent dehydrogenase (short-subunit alcohol dehydrogenase family) [Stackebrandtia endophytica]|uniref:NAD(P)-dependent dehydrogenase (Short-subunit alcohol dehydrogenase family) n=1 Tax=Stackebrandtia endophytica TaxID=1496996 RepID=A0A543AW39_9ACTN|nr:NAD(P)-dependent dehydrogenase (short-subunit alcohol dehydrogenase family) [Stackebrandtia endophytica]